MNPLLHWHERLNQSRSRWMDRFARSSRRACLEGEDSERPLVGLALSSGAARGLAHIGVIQALEKHGVPIDAIAGASMGAYVGACWATGLDGEDLEGLAAEIETPRDRLKLLDPQFPPRRGFIRGDRIRQRLHRTVGNRCFEDLERRLIVVTTRMGTYEACLVESGRLDETVHASLAVPGICTPVRIGDADYVDGGVSEPLPVDILRDIGMDVVVAVSVIPSVEELRSMDFHRPQNRGKGIIGFLNRHVNYFAEGNILDILRKSAMGAQIKVAEASGQRADVFIRPTTATGHWHDYHNHGAYIEEGRRATELHIDSIRALVAPDSEAALKAAAPTETPDYLTS